METMKKIKRSIAILLSVVMLISTFPTQVLAYYAPKPETLSIVDSNGKKVDINEDWTTTFPYGTFAFATGDMVMDEGGDGKITVYRLGGSKGRATAYITYVPVAAEIKEGVKTYANAAGSKDVEIQVEDPLPIAAYQPVGKDPDPLVSDVTIDINMENSEDDEVTSDSVISIDSEVATDSVISVNSEVTTDSDISTDSEITTNSDNSTDGVCLTVNVDADSYQWYILADGNWEMVSGATEKNFILATDHFETYDFRCVYKLDALTYCTNSAKGVSYVMPEQEELEEIPADLDLNPETTYTQLIMDDPDEYAGYVFELTFAEDEWVKEIQVSSPEDVEAEADKFGMFTIVDCDGGSLYDTANTLLLHIVDNEAPESSEIGFKITDILEDKSSGSAYLTVKRTGGTQNVLSVDYATKDGTAVSGKDYSAANGTLMFYGDINEQVIEIPLIDDGKKTDNQVSFTVTISNLKGDKAGNCTLTETKAIISLFNTATSESPNLATLLYDDNDVIDVSEKVDEKVNTIAPTTGIITGQEVEIITEPVVATLTSESGSELDPLTYNYPNKLQFSRNSGYNDWRDWNYVAANSSYSYYDINGGLMRGWYGGSIHGSAGWKAESKGATSSILPIPDMNKLYSRFISSFSWRAAIGSSLYGLEYTYPWFKILRSNFSKYASADAGTTGSYSFWKGSKISWYTSGYMNESWNISDNVSYLQLGLSRHDCHDAKSNAMAALEKGALQRRTLNNSLSLRVYTANDSGSGVGGVKTSPDGSASLNQATGVYNDMIPEVKIVSGKGGVNYSGKLYVGSEIEVKLKNTPSYFPATDDSNLDCAVYLTNSNGDIKASSTSTGNTHKLKLIWNGMTDADLNDNYTVNIVMTRKQTLKLDISPSVERMVQDGNISANIDINKIGSAINEFWSNNGNNKNITYGYSSTNKNPPHFTYNSNGSLSQGSFTVSNTGTVNDAILEVKNISNLQWINFNREPEDIIVYNGRAYAGNEKIWLDVSDLSLSNMTFRYYDKKYKTASNVMTTEISDTYLYLDSNGNGRIDGYYNEYTGYFRLDDTLEVKDELILYLEPGVDYDESVFSPIPVYDTVDGKTVITGYRQYFLKTFYTMTPRCLTIPEGASTEDKAQVLPAFIADVTDPNTYSSLTSEQQDYRYIISGKGRYYMPTGENHNVIDFDENDYARSSDEHIMYGAEASKPAFVDIPLGGDNNPPSITDDGTGFTWSPDFHGNLLYKFAETQPIYIPHSIAGDNIPVAEVEINSETGEVTFKDDNAVEKINGYLGSFGNHDTYALCVQEQNYTTEEIAEANGISISDLGLQGVSGPTEQPNPESVSIGSSGCFPNADYLKQNKATGDTGDPNLDMSQSGNEFEEFNLDLGVKLPTADIGITDYVSIVLDEYEVGFSIGIPLGGYNSNGDAGAGGVGGGDTGEWSGPKKANAAKAEDMGKLKNFLKNPSKDTFKATDDSYTDAKDNGKMKSSSFSVDFSVSIAFLFKYNTVDNEFKFSQFTVAVAAELQFKYQYRLTPCPIVYVYVTVGISLEIGTGMTVDRDTVEEAIPVLAESDTITLKKGETYSFETLYKAFNVTFDGKLYIDSEDPTDDLNSGFIKSEGDKPVTVTLKKQDGTELDETYNIKITALEDTTLTKVARITDMRNDVYWNGFVISPEAFVEAGAGIGVEICKFEIFIKVSIGCQMTLGSYDKDDKSYDPFEFEEFEFALGLGFRVVLLVFSYEMDLISYSITYDSERPENKRWVHSWAALGGLYGDDIGTLSATDSKGNIQSVHIRLPGSTVDTQTIYAPDDGDLSTMAYNPSDAQVPFQLSGYGSSGDAFKLVDGLITGYDYKVVTVGKDNYLIYTMGRNAVNEVDYSMLVMSKLELTKTDEGDSYGLVQPDTGEKGGYLILDDDGTGDLGFTAWVEDDTTNASIHATWVSYDSVSDVAPTSPTEPTSTTPVGIIDNGDGTTSSAIMNEDNYTDKTLFPVPVVPDEPTEPTEDRPETEVAEPEDERPLEAPDPTDIEKYTNGEDDDAYKADLETYNTLIAAWEAWELQQEWEKYDDDKLAYDDAKEIYDAYNAWVTYYSTNDNVNAYYQTRAANAAKNTIIKHASFTIGDNDFTAAETVSGAAGSHVFLPDSDGDGNAIFFAEAIHYSSEEEITAAEKYDDYLNTAYPSDDVGSSDSIKEYRSLYQKGLRDAYGKGTTLNVAIKKEDNSYEVNSKPLSDGEILENIEVMEYEDGAYYLTYTTSEQVYNSDKNDLLTIRKLYLRKVSISGESVTWSDPYLLRTLHDYDQNKGQDGLYKGLTLSKEYDEPYFANLQFIYGKLGELTEEGELITLSEETEPENFLLFEMNGSTYIITANDLNNIITKQEGTIYPFFSPKALPDSEDETAKASSTGRSEVTIGADGAGNIAAVYVGTVPNTLNNALFLTKYDPNTSSWGTGIMLAMNYMQVYEDAITDGLTVAETEEAFFDSSKGGGMDQFIFSNLQIALGQKDESEDEDASGEIDPLSGTVSMESPAIDKDLAALYGLTDSELSPLSEDAWEDKLNALSYDQIKALGGEPTSTQDTLLVITQGNLTYLKERTVSSGSAIIAPMSDDEALAKFDDTGSNRKPGVGVYAISYGVGGQRIGDDKLTFVDYDFTTGSKLKSTVSFVNTGDVAIRGSDDNPVDIELRINIPGEGDILLDKWIIKQNIVSGQKVELYGTSEELTATLPTGSIFYITVSEDKDYIGDDAFFASTLITENGAPISGTLTVESKPELGFEHSYIKSVGLDDEGNTIIDIDFQVGNRGTKDATGVYVQFTYENGVDEQNRPIYESLDITGHNLEISKQEELETLNASTPGELTSGILRLYNAEDGDDIGINKGRTVTGTIKVSPECYKGLLTDSCNLQLEIFSDDDNTLRLSAGVITAEHDEYNSINNISTRQIEHETYFVSADKVTLALGNTMRLPVSISTSTGKAPQITALEMPDGNDNNRNLGILYFNSDDNFENGSMTGTLVIAPSKEGSGIIHLMDTATNTVYAITYSVTPYTEGINIFNDNSLFTFYNDNKSEYNAGQSGQSWDFRENIPEWGEGLDKDTPYLSNLAYGNKGASFTFRTVGYGMHLYFKGTVKVESTYPGFNAKTISSEGGKNYIDFYFGRNTTSYPHDVTITVLTDEGAQFDRIKEKYWDNVVPTPSDDENSPHIYWSRSFPDVASIETGTDNVNLTCYVLDDIGLTSVTFNGQEPVLTKNDDRFWQFDAIVSENKTLSVIAMDNSGNRTARTYTVNWFNETVSAGTIADAPEMSAEFQFDDGTPIGNSFVTKGEKAFLKVIADDTDTVTVKYITVQEDESSSYLKFTVLNTDDSSRFPVANNGYYQVTTTDEGGIWRSEILYMNQMDTTLPEVTLSEADLSEQGEDNVRELSWSVTKGGTSLSHISKVTINDLDMSFPEQQTRVAGTWPIYFGGVYTLNGSDAAGNNAPVSYTVNDYIIDLSAESVLSLTHSWNQDRNNGSISIDSNKISGGMYDVTLSDLSHGIYYGNYEYALIPSEQDFSFDFALVETSILEEYASNHPDAPDMPDEELSVAIAIKEEEERVAWLIDLVKPEKDALWTGNDIISDITPGLYTLYVRDAQDKNNHKVVKSLALTVNDEAISFTSEVEPARSGNANGVITITASGGRLNKGTYQFAILPMEEQNTPLVDVKDMSNNPDVTWQFSDIDSESLEIGILKDLKPGWYQVGVRAMGAPEDTMNNLFKLNIDVENAKKRLDDANTANTESAIISATASLVAEIRSALQQWDNAIENVDEMEAVYKGLIENNADIINKLDAWRTAEEDVINSVITREEADNIKKIYDDAIDEYASNKATIEASTELSNATSALAVEQADYDDAASKAIVAAEQAYTATPELWDNAYTQAVYVKNITREDLAHFDYSGDGKVIVTLNKPNIELNGTQKIKLANHNKDNKIIIDGRNLHVVIPKGTLSKGDDIMDMLMLNANVPKDPTGYAVQCTKEDGETFILPLCTIENGKLSYMAIYPGEYSFVQNVKTYDDVDSDFWGKEAIKFVTTNEIFQGTGSTTFGPNNTMTRAMLVTVLGRLVNISESEYTEKSFDDIIKDTWYSAYIQWASENGIVTGYGDGSFRPNDIITREQMCTIIVRFLTTQGFTLPENETTVFNDADSISDWALEAVSYCQSIGLIKGVGDNNVNPLGKSKRAAVATLFMRLIKGILNN